MHVWQKKLRRFERDDAAHRAPLAGRDDRDLERFQRELTVRAVGLFAPSVANLTRSGTEAHPCLRSAPLRKPPSCGHVDNAWRAAARAQRPDGEDHPGLTHLSGR